MTLSFLDWLIIGAYFVISLVIGLWYRKRASKSVDDFFLSGRNMPWLIAGLSMVATTFAADTPLAVTELVALNGISGNWLWWNMLIGGMLTTFFFARYWRKAEILTELEFIEFRYSGKPAVFLRGFKSIYLGLIINTLIIAWVNKALMTILQVFFDLPEDVVLWYVAGAMTITVLYSSLSGLWGVAITDVIQFIIAMAGCIILAIIVLGSEQIGGIAGLKAQLPSWSLEFFPKIDSFSSAGSVLSISIGAFLAFIGVQWWASWYPGAEPGGGGYIAQRMMSCKDEKHSIFATLFFQIAHYCLRPWPWILVGLATLVLYPNLAEADKKMGYVMAMKDFLPSGLKGMLLVAFLAAYMSTIATQLNWGASYLVNDLYKRFIKKDNQFTTNEKAQKHYVNAAKIFTVIIMIVSLFVTTKITTISGVWSFIIECGAGLGMVLILRWYWWRINAWTEIVATITPFVAYAFAKLILENYFPESFIINKGTYFFTVGVTTIAWLVTVFVTKPTNNLVLQNFYNKIKPEGYWGRFKQNDATREKSRIPMLLVCWLSSIVFTYSILFLIGYLIFQEWKLFAIYSGSAFVSLLVLLWAVKKTKIFE